MYLTFLRAGNYETGATPSVEMRNNTKFITVVFDRPPVFYVSLKNDRM